MLPYYIKLPELKLSRSCIARIASKVLANPEIANSKLVGPDYFYKSTVLGNYFWNNDSELIVMQKRFLLPVVHKTLLYYSPGSNAVMHRDAMPGRVSIMYWPLYPEPERYDPLSFWEMEGDEPKQVANVGTDGRPFVFNALSLHSVDYCTSPRINLQLSFHEPIEYIEQLIKENKFFR